MNQHTKKGIHVIFAPIFIRHLKNFPKADREKIRTFAEHIEQFGFDGLKGRNKSSDNVPKDNPNWAERVAYAQQHKLWHYHIGIPDYQLSDKGDYVSEYVLHYIKESDYIMLVDMSPHPPFELPKPEYLSK